MYKPSLEEQETTINYDRSDDMARIYTADPMMMRKLDKIAAENAALAMKSQDEIGRWYECPKSWIKVQKPRQVSQETRDRLAEYSRSKT